MRRLAALALVALGAGAALASSSPKAGHYSGQVNHGQRVTFTYNAHDHRVTHLKLGSTTVLDSAAVHHHDGRYSFNAGNAHYRASGTWTSSGSGVLGAIRPNSSPRSEPSLHYSANATH